MNLDGVKRVLRELTGRANTDFTEGLCAQVEACLEGARIADRCSRGELEATEALERIVEVEHRGDERRAELVEALAKAIVTPIDREDLFRVSRSIDDVLDNLRDYVREVDLFVAPVGAEPFGEITRAIIESVEALGSAVSDLADDPARVADAAMAAKKRGNDIRELYERAVSGLLEGDEPADGESLRALLRSRELLRRLDVVGLRLGEAADALADGMMKRSL